MKNDLYIIIGETATGKTSLSIDLQQKIRKDNSNTKIEIINADHTQFYRELNYSVCKIEEKDKCGIKHHLLNHLSVYKQKDTDYNVKDFVIDCRKKIEEIVQKNNTPVIVGGTHYYIYQLLSKNTDTKRLIKNQLIENDIDNIHNYQENTNKNIKKWQTNNIKFLQTKYILYKLLALIKFVLFFKFKYIKNIPYPLNLNNSDSNNKYRLQSAINILQNNYINNLESNVFEINTKSDLWDKYNIKILYTNKYDILIKSNREQYKNILKIRWDNNDKKISNLYKAFVEYKSINTKLMENYTNNIHNYKENINNLALIFKIFTNLKVNNWGGFWQNYDNIINKIINADYKYAKRQHLFIKKYFKQYLD